MGPYRYTAVNDLNRVAVCICFIRRQAVGCKVPELVPVVCQFYFPLADRINPGGFQRAVFRFSNAPPLLRGQRNRPTACVTDILAIRDPVQVSCYYFAECFWILPFIMWFSPFLFLLNPLPRFYGLYGANQNTQMAAHTFVHIQCRFTICI